MDRRQLLKFIAGSAVVGLGLGQMGRAQAEPLSDAEKFVLTRNAGGTGGTGGSGTMGSPRGHGPI